MLSISSARIPIVKCVDAISGVSCDLSFKNKNAVYNSAFIKELISIHGIILHFTFIIRYWALRQSLAGGVVGSGGLRINNYALTMLVIFFLQSEKIVPSVRKLQEGISEEESTTVGGWQFGYNKKEMDMLKHNMAKYFEKTWKWKEMLCRFFKFYLNFDYENNVISPYAGKGIPRNTFKDIALSVKVVNGETLPSEICKDVSVMDNENMISYWTQVKDGDKYLLSLTTPLCLQDPFEHNFCVSRGFNKVGILNWRNHCLVAFVYLQLSLSCSGTGVVGMFQATTKAPTNRNEQREITNKINSATGLKLAVNAGKRNKTRTGKPKPPNNSTIPEAKQK